MSLSWMVRIICCCSLFLLITSRGCMCHKIYIITTVKTITSSDEHSYYYLLYINIATILLGNAKRVATLLSIGRRALRRILSHARSFLWWLNADDTCLYMPLSTKTRSAETPTRCCHRLFRDVETLIKRCHRILQRTIRGYYIR